MHQSTVREQKTFVSGISISDKEEIVKYQVDNKATEEKTAGSKTERGCITRRIGNEAVRNLISYQNTNTDQFNGIMHGVLHDLANFLSIVFGNLELSLAGNGCPNQQDCALSDQLNDSRNAAKRAIEIQFWFRNLLDGKEATHRPIAVKSLVQDTIDLVRCQYPEHSYSLDVNAIRLITGVDILLRQVFMNILLNAAQAQDIPGEIKVTIFTQVLIFDEYEEEPNEYLVIAIKDSGNGMHFDVLSEIFKSGFSTKGKSCARRGYGLAFTRWVIEEVFQGKIIVSTRPGTGTTFLIYLPIPKH